MTELADRHAPRPVLESLRQFTGQVWDIDTDLVDLGIGGTVSRDYVSHPGAVAIMALNERDELFLVCQYRHPVRSEVWEPPAGLMDVDGEDALTAARRELHEEADLEADTWHVLLDVYTSPGGSSEGIRIFLARDLREVPEGERFEREHEEADMDSRWVPLADAVDAVLTGRASGPTLVMGALAVDAARRVEWRTLRNVDAPWHRPPGRG